MWSIAHRGGAGLWPENTLAAFVGARALGCDGAELDVQLCADGAVVVHHDARLDPAYCRGPDGRWLAGEGPRLRDLNLAQLRAYDIGRPDPAGDYARRHPVLTPVDGARVPSLEQVVAVVRHAPFLLFVELKSDPRGSDGEALALAEAALAVLREGGVLDRAVFVGFDWRGLLRVKSRAPAARCWFTTDRLQGDARPGIDGIMAAGADGWFAHFANATPENVAYARAHGLKVGAWTVNDPADMHRLLDLDVLCTDRPDVLAALLPRS